MERYQMPEVEVIEMPEMDVVTASKPGSGGGIILPDDEW